MVSRTGRALTKDTRGGRKIDSSMNNVRTRLIVIGAPAAWKGFMVGRSFVSPCDWPVRSPQWRAGVEGLNPPYRGPVH